jgi:hypothetical protein
LYENCHARWFTLWDWCQVPENKGKKQPNLNGKYTVTDKGQQKWGGWTNDGLVRFNTLYQAVKLARKSKEGAQLEEETLVLLRQKHKIMADNLEDHQNHQKRLQRAKKKGGNLMEVGDVYMPSLNAEQPMCDDDEDDEDEDDEDSEGEDSEGGQEEGEEGVQDDDDPDLED